MSDMLIRDVPEDVLIAIDANAARLGLSRSEYVRRELARVAQHRQSRLMIFKGSSSRLVT
jgi:antitoxin component of RelBE/YafQ-DinJ toxin-antitoxin module